MAIQLGTDNQLVITLPSQGDLNWASSFQTEFAQKIVEHDHTGGGRGAKIKSSALVSETDVANGLDTRPAVITEVIDDNAVTEDKLADSSWNDDWRAVDSDHIKTGAVTGSKLSDGSVSSSKLSGSLMTQINTNTSDITSLTSSVSSNDTDIAALDTRVTTSENNISIILSDYVTSTTTNALDTRITTLEGTSSAPSYELGSNANNDLPSYLSNAKVIIDSQSPTTISNKEFENVDFALDSHVTFSNCTFRSCTFAESDNFTVPYDLTFSQGNIYSCSIRSFNNVFFDNIDVRRSNIVACTDVAVNNIVATGSRNFSNNIVNVTRNFEILGHLAGTYPTVLSGNNVKFHKLFYFSNSHDNITITSGEYSGRELYSDSSYRIALSSSNLPVFHISEEASNFVDASNSSFSTGYINMATGSGSNTIVNISGSSLPSFKILDGVYEEYDKGGSGNLKILVADNNQLTPSAAHTEDNIFSQFSTGGNRYNPNSLINASNQFIPTSSGLYIFNVTTSFATAISKRYLKIYVNGGTPVEFSSDSDGTVNTGDVLLNLTASDAVTVTVETNGTNTVDYVYSIKQIV